MRATHPISRRQRVLALVSLLATGVVTLAVVLFLVRNAGYVIAGLAGLVLAIAGGWWILSERSIRRAMGIAGLAIGVGILVVALLGVGESADHVLLHVGIVGVALAVAITAARAALAEDLRAVRVEVRGRSLVPPAHAVLLCNPWSGGGKVERFGLVQQATSLGVETIMLNHGLDLGQLARDAIARGADCLGMAGGDGSQALVASIAVEHDLPFVCVSAGTRNHFALDLGLDRDDPRKSLYAFRDAVERRIDYASVNGRFFVNNVSLGVYATIVQEEGYREAKAETSKALLPDLLGRTQEPFDLQFTTPEGDLVDGSFLIQVSNNPYVLAASLDLSQRRRLDSGRLGVFAVSAATGTQAAEVLTLALAGHGGLGSHAFEFATEEFEVRSRSGKAFAGIDGEALELDTPLRFRIHPLGLRLLVPAGNLEAAARREAREIRARDLWTMVRGTSRTGADH